MSEQLVPVSQSLLSEVNYDHLMRVAKMYAESQLVPPVFQKNIPNVIIAMEIAQRMNASPLMVFQNLNVIHGKPSFSATFMIASVNSCGRFTSMRFHFVGERDTEDFGCYATAKSKEDNTECKGTTVTMGTAKAEGWIGRTGSKWRTMPELMLQYRAATWWTRMFAPEMLMGFPTDDEVYDIKNVTPAAEPEKPADVPPPVKKGKGVAALKQDKEKEKDVTPPKEPPAEQQKAPPVSEPAKDTTTPAANGEKKTEPLPAETPGKISRVRCEITDLTEKAAKKKDGNGLVTLVGLKGEWAGQAYYDGPKTKLPAEGGLIDVTLEEKIHNNIPVHILKTFEVIG